MQIKIYKNPIVLWSVIVCCFLVCIWSFYSIIDQAVTLDHSKRQSELFKMQRDILEDVLNVIGKDADENTVRNILMTSDDLIFEKNEGHVVANQVSFYFLNKKLIKIDVGKEDNH